MGKIVEEEIIDIKIIVEIIVATGEDKTLEVTIIEAEA